MNDETNKPLQQYIPAEQASAIAPFGTVSNFETAMRMARALASSTIVPREYQGESAIGNNLIAMELAFRTGSSIMAVMQSLNIIHGRPSFSGKYKIAAINRSGKFAEPLHFEFVGTEGQDDWGCRAVTTSKTGKRVEGPLVTIEMAKKEGWYDRKDKHGNFCSKWRTMPELMMRYRSASMFGDTEAPEITLGMQTTEELQDIGPQTIDHEPALPRRTMEDMMRESVPQGVVTQRANQNESPYTMSKKEADAIAEPEESEWPKWDEERQNWFGSDDVYWTPDVHPAFPSDGKPGVNADGTLRAGRGKAIHARELAAKAKQARESQEPAPWEDSGPEGVTMRHGSEPNRLKPGEPPSFDTIMRDIADAEAEEDPQNALGAISCCDDMANALKDEDERNKALDAAAAAYQRVQAKLKQA